MNRVGSVLARIENGWNKLRDFVYSILRLRGWPLHSAC